MSTSRSLQLRALAERFAGSLPPIVQEIVLTGSTSRSVADELSDIELLVVTETLPPLEDCLAATGFDDHWTPDGTLWWTGGSVDGEDVEAIWWSRARVEQRIEDVLAARVYDHQRVRTAEALVHGVALRGDRLAEWQRRLAAYPDALAERIVDDAAETWHESARSERALLRDRLPLARRLVEDAENVLRIV